MTRDIRPGDEVMVGKLGAHKILIDVSFGPPVNVVIGLIGTAVIPTDDGDGWVIHFKPFGEAALPSEWLI